MTEIRIFQEASRKCLNYLINFCLQRNNLKGYRGHQRFILVEISGTDVIHIVGLNSDNELEFLKCGKVIPLLCHLECKGQPAKIFGKPAGAWKFGKEDFPSRRFL